MSCDDLVGVMLRCYVVVLLRCVAMMFACYFSVAHGVDVLRCSFVGLLFCGFVIFVYMCGVRVRCAFRALVSACNLFAAPGLAPPDNSPESCPKGVLHAPQAN